MEAADDRITLFPNPATREVTISSAWFEISSVQIRLLNSAGQLIFCQTYDNAHEIKLNVSKLSKGVYLVQCSSGSKSGSIPLII